MKVTFKNSADKISLSAAQELHKIGIAVAADNGKDISFILEREGVSCERKNEDNIGTGK